MSDPTPPHDQEEVRLRRMTIVGGVAEFEMVPPTSFASAFLASARGSLQGVENYVEYSMRDTTTAEKFVVTVQRAGKLTPHQAREEAEAHAAALQAQVDAVTVLHAPEIHYHRSNPYGWAQECDHCYEPVRDQAGALTPTHFEDEHGELRCRTRPCRTCTHCLTNWGEEAPWPCDTAQLLQKDEG